ncbi:MAG: hypothetical protein JZD40_04480 [Sulfolobus sp.]|nr:hypothetical protein [Sulfolobus sp.]
MSSFVSKGVGRNIEELIFHASKYVFLMVPFFDKFYAEKLIELAKNGVEIKVITTTDPANEGYHFMVKRILEHRKSEVDESYKVYKSMLAKYDKLRALKIILPVISGVLAVLFFMLSIYFTSLYLIGIPISSIIIGLFLYKDLNLLKNYRINISVVTENYRRLEDEVKREREMLCRRLYLIGLPQDEKYFSARMIISDGGAKIFTMNLTRDEIDESIGIVSDIPIEVAEREFIITWALYENKKDELCKDLLKATAKEKTR